MERTKKIKENLSKLLRKVNNFKGRLLRNKSRYDLINFLINKNGYQSYLEIGIQDGLCLSKVNCQSKIGVDPYPKILELKGSVIIRKTSDDFFADNKSKFDIIFIDGLHTHEQSYKDFLNAATILNDNGLIVLHDCNPIDEEHAISFDKGGKWNGDVYKTILKIASSGFYTVRTVDIDHGCGVVNLSPTGITFDYEPNYDWFKRNRKSAINLMSWREFTGHD